MEDLPEKASRYTVWDADMKGFGVRVSTNGRKAFVVRYRTIGGADRLMVLGALGVFTPEEARERARLMLAEAAKGGDPQQMKMGHRHEMTVADLCELYMAEGTALKKASMRNRAVPRIRWGEFRQHQSPGQPVAADQCRIFRASVPDNCRPLV